MAPLACIICADGDLFAENSNVYLTKNSWDYAKTRCVGMESVKKRIVCRLNQAINWRVLRLETLESRNLLSATPYENLMDFVEQSSEVNAVFAVESAVEPFADSIALPNDLSDSVPDNSTWLVTTFDDVVDDSDDVLSLREAIGGAQDGDTIAFVKSGTVVLTGSQLEISKSITIDATSVYDAVNKSPGVIVDGASLSRIFSISGESVSIIGLSICNGKVESGTGGGLYSYDCDVTLVNCFVTNNTAKMGGGIGTAKGTVALIDSVVSNNIATSLLTDSYGGGIYAEHGVLSVINSVISDNVSSAPNSEGGGIYSSSEVTLTNSFISNNTSNFGGGISVNCVNTTITNSVISNNTAYRGGGLNISSGTVTVTDSSVTNNCSTSYGGGVYSSGSLIFTNGMISGNTASSGGGIYAFTSATVYLTNCLILDNKAFAYSKSCGGGIYILYGNLKITNSVIFRNTVSSVQSACGGGIYLDSERVNSLTVLNSTISGNNALSTDDTENARGGISYAGGISGNRSVKMFNTIVAMNYADSEVDFSGSIEIEENCLVGTDPQFVSKPLFVDGVLSNPDEIDLHLTSRSVAIDHGSNVYNESELDFDSNLRVVASLSTSETVDIGAYEYQFLATMKDDYSGMVTTDEDVCDLSDGKISIREALFYSGEGDTITFAPSLNGATINLNGSELYVIKKVFVDASDLLDRITFNAERKSRVLISFADSSFNFVVFTNGESLSHGGGIFFNSNLTLNNCIVIDNFATSGGGLYRSSASGADLVLTNSSILNNTTTSSGGGIYASGGSLMITDSVISGNISLSDGGGIYSVSGSVDMTNCEISNNTAEFSGGGIYKNSSYLTLVGCVVSDNVAISHPGNAITPPSSYGAGIYAHQATLAIENSVIMNNTVASLSSASGGAIFANGGSLVTVKNSKISKNGSPSSKSYGGGISAQHCNRLDVINSEISSNTATYGGGVYVGSFGSQTTITNCTISSNYGLYGYGIDNSKSGIFKIYNSIIVLNMPNDVLGGVSANNVLSSTNLSESGENNIVYDPEIPLFRDAANGDYQLTFNSQAWDAGNDEYAYSAGMDDNSRDLANKSRFIDESIDLGAYEYEACVPIAPSDLTVGDFNVSSHSVSVSWNDNSFDETGFIVQYSYDSENWKSISVALNETSATLTDLQLGKTYEVRVAAANQVGDSPFTSGIFTTPDVPVSPSNLVIGKFNVLTRSVLISWEDNSSDETGFVALYSNDGEIWGSVSIAANETTATLNDLQLGATYTVRVAATSEIGESTFISGAFTTPNVPVAPSRLTIGDFNAMTCSLSVSWKDNSSTETGFVVQYSRNNGNWVVLSIDANKTSTTLSELVPDSLYRIRVAAMNEVGYSTFVSSSFRTPVVPIVDVSVSSVASLSSYTIVVGGALSVDKIVVTNEGTADSEAVSLCFYATTSGVIDEEAVLMKTIDCGQLAPGAVVVVSSEMLPTLPLSSGATYHVVWSARCSNDVDLENNLGSVSAPVTVCRESGDVAPVSFDRESYSTHQGDAFWLETWLSTSAPGPQMYSFWFDFGDGSFVERVNRGVVSANEFSNIPGERAVSVKVVNLATKSVVARGDAPFTVIRVMPAFNVEAKSAFGGDAVFMSVEAVFPIPTPVYRWVFNWGDGEKTEIDRLGTSLWVSHWYSSDHKERTITLDVEFADGETYSVCFDTRLLRDI